MFSAELLSVDLPTVTVTPPEDDPDGISDETDKPINHPTVTVTPPADPIETSNTKETDKSHKPNRTVLPDRVITKAGLAKLASDEGKVSRNVSRSGTVTHLVEDNAGNTFVVANKHAGKKIIAICSCSPDGICHSFHVMAVDYFNTGITKAPCLIPSNVNMRKKSSLQSKKSTKTFGRKKPDKIAFQKYAKVQSDLVEKQKDLELDSCDEDDDDEVFVFPDAIQKELDSVDADKPLTELLECKVCGQGVNSERGLKIHTSRMHGKEADAMDAADSVVSAKLSNKTSAELFSCKFCDQVVNSERGLKIHTSRMHKKTSKGC